MQKRQQQQGGDPRRDGDHREETAPVPDVDHPRQRPAGERCAKVGKQPDKARRRACRLLVGALRRRHADQHLRAKDEEADGEEARRLHHVAGERHQPQRADGEQNPGGENEVHRTAVAVEQLIRAPARHQRADKPAQLEHRHRRVSGHQIHAQRLGHVQVAPVVDGRPHHVDQHVAERQQPDVGVFQHVSGEDLLAGQPRALLLLGDLHLVVPPVAHRRKADGLRPVAQAPAEEQPGDNREATGNHHSRAPAVVQRRRPHHHRDQRPADVMRGVPDCPPAAALVA